MMFPLKAMTSFLPWRLQWAGGVSFSAESDSAKFITLLFAAGSRTLQSADPCSARSLLQRNNFQSDTSTRI
jgi:hypothetical protein